MPSVVLSSESRSRTTRRGVEGWWGTGMTCLAHVRWDVCDHDPTGRQQPGTAARGWGRCTGARPRMRGRRCRSRAGGGTCVQGRGERGQGRAALTPPFTPHKAGGLRYAQSSAERRPTSNCSRPSADRRLAINRRRLSVNRRRLSVNRRRLPGPPAPDDLGPSSVRKSGEVSFRKDGHGAGPGEGPGKSPWTPLCPPPPLTFASDPKKKRGPALSSSAATSGTASPAAAGARSGAGAGSPSPPRRPSAAASRAARAAGV